MNEAIWTLEEEITEEDRKALSDYPDIIAQLLVNRGIRTKDDAERFLHPDYERDTHDPFLFQDMEKVLKRILKARDKEERVVVHGDYDADGVCASVLLIMLLKELGFSEDTIDVYIPHRATEGYGLNIKTVDEQAKLKTSLIITCDCGVTNRKEIAYAKEKGIDVIVTDHHLAPEELPDAYALINPNIPGEKYPFKPLSGTGVAFKVAQAFAKRGHIDSTAEKWLLDLVVIGTVTDFSSLIGENRTFAAYGLVVLGKARRTGIKALLDVMRTRSREMTTKLIGYGIGPRLNAAGRIDHATIAYKLFMADDRTQAYDNARELNAINTERQRMGEEIANDAKKQIGLKNSVPNILFAYDPSWPGGVVGAVASRLANEYNRPTIIVGRQEEKIIGSCRSIEGVNINDMVKRVSEAFDQFGGHMMACGFTVKKDYSIDRLRDQFHHIAEGINTALLIPRVHIDAELDLFDVQMDLYNILRAFAPYGEGNPVPRFLLRHTTVVDFRPVGKKKDHLKVTLRGKKSIVRQAIAFGLGEWAERLTIGDHIECIAEIVQNTWKNRKELQLKIIDIRMANTRRKE